MTYVPTRVVPTQWSCSPHLVKTRRLSSYKKCSSTLWIDMRTWDTDMDFCTDGHVNLKTSFELCFLLAIFTSVFLHSKVLFNILQMKELEMQFCLKRVTYLLWLSSEGEDELSCICKEAVSETQAGFQDDVRNHYKQLHSGIKDRWRTVSDVCHVWLHGR